MGRGTRQTAVPMLHLLRGASDQSKQHVWLATECVAWNSVASPSKKSLHQQAR